jgi:hypothetical protein
VVPRLSGARPLRAVIVCGAVAASAIAVLFATQAVSVPFTGARPATSPLDETIAQRAASVETVKEQASAFGCDAPTSSDQIAGCHEMQSRIAGMEAELVTLKARAGGRWVQGGGEVVEAQGFLENLFGGMFRDRPQRAEPRYVAPRERRAPRQSQTVERGTYRTMCVRTCDGYYWPVSFATNRSRFKQDARICQDSCAADVKLYTYQNPGEGVGDMVDLKGGKYSDTPTAFKHQVKYDSACRCGPQPWTAEAQAMYDARAATQVAGAKKSGERVQKATARREGRRSRSARRERAANRRHAGERRRYSRRDAYALGYDDPGRW